MEARVRFVDGSRNPSARATQVSDAAIRLGINKVQLILGQESRRWETITPTRQFVRRVDMVRKKEDRVYQQHVGRITDMLRFSYLVQDYESALVFDRVRTPNNPLPPDADLVKSYTLTTNVVRLTHL
jgi:hypothetical protein